LRTWTSLALLTASWFPLAANAECVVWQYEVVDESLAERWPAATVSVERASFELAPDTSLDSIGTDQPSVSAIEDMIEQIAGSHDVDTGLVKAVVQAESAFDPSAKSHRGAAGLMQLMPCTAARYGVHDPADPGENIRAGVRHLKYLLQLFENDTTLALAAYNAGETAVRRYQGIPPYRETQAYVTKVLTLQRTYNQSDSQYSCQPLC